MLVVVLCGGAMKPPPATHTREHTAIRVELNAQKANGMLAAFFLPIFFHRDNLDRSDNGNSAQISGETIVA